MKNYFRALSFAWPYRGRIAIAFFCALCAAALWGANFLCIYPVLKMLSTRQPLHKIVDDAVADVSKDVARWQVEADKFDERQKELEKGLEADPGSKELSNQKRKLASDQLRVENKLARARHQLYWYQVGRWFAVSWLPVGIFTSLATLMGLMVLGILLKCLFEFVQESLVGSIVNRTVLDLRNLFFRRAIHLDVSQVRQQGSTELQARVTNDMEAVGAGLKVSFGKVVAEPLRILSCIALACMISWQLTAFFLILVPLAVVVLHRVTRVMRKATRRVLEQMSSLLKILQESFQGIRAVKLFNQEAHERKRFNDAARDYHDRATRVAVIEALCDPVVEILGITAVALALLVGSYLVITKRTHLFGIPLASAPLDHETLLQLYVLLLATADPIRKLSSVFTRLQSAFAASDRVFAAMDTLPTITGNPNGPRVARPAGVPDPRTGEVIDGPTPLVPRIEFRDVCFSYEPKAPTLSDINLTVRAGETVALVGPNGCGKSTLASLMVRFHDPDHGSVLIDGQDVREVNLRSLRQEVCLVTQSAILFDGTIFDNIAYGLRGATAEQVEAAAKLAMAHEFIMGLEKGYQTPIGEMRMVSGGETQWLALARALLRSPSILILDEFTSAVDAEKDLDIHLALKDFKQGRTVFIITHRLNTLEIADRIVVLDKGRIVAVGTHLELLATCGVYQRLQEAHGQRLAA